MKWTQRVEMMENKAQSGVLDAGSVVGRKASGRLRAKTVPVPFLADATREQLWQLYFRYYADVTREQFLADLADKSHVILLFDRGNPS